MIAIRESLSVRLSVILMIHAETVQDIISSFLTPNFAIMNLGPPLKSAKRGIPYLWCGQRKFDQQSAISETAHDSM